MKHKIIILSDEIQIGKTTFLKEFCKNKKNIGGILTPVINGKRMFYAIANNVYFDMEAAENEESLSIGKYFFSETAFAKAENIILNEIDNKNLQYLIIDEIGPLEIVKHQGFYELLNTILESTFYFTLVLVVRKKLIDEFVNIFNIQNSEILNLADFKNSLHHSI